MRTEKQVYKRIEQLEGLKQGMLNRLVTLQIADPQQKIILTDVGVIESQIHELLWVVDNICPKCNGDKVDYDHEYYYCEDCDHVWKIEF
jgi:hypothetical protein